jgi:hypothetical protein
MPVDLAARRAAAAGGLGIARFVAVVVLTSLRFAALLAIELGHHRVPAQLRVFDDRIARLAGEVCRQLLPLVGIGTQPGHNQVVRVLLVVGHPDRDVLVEHEVLR